MLRSMRSLRPHVLVAGTPKMSLLSLVAARMLRVPVRIYLCHGLRFEGANGLARRTLQLLERVLITCATDVVAVSATVRDALITMGASTARLHLVGHGSANGVDHHRFTSEVPDKVATRQFSDETPFVLLFVGRLTRDKGTLELEAIARHFSSNPNVLLKIVGTPEAADQEDQRRIERLTTMAGVDYIPHVVDVERAYGAADLLVLPTRREGLSTVVIEAGACGVPTVAYAVTGTIDCIQDGVTGTLVPPGDLGGLIRAIETFADDPERTKGAGRAAARLVRARFDQPVVWQLWAEFLAARRESWAT